MTNGKWLEAKSVASDHCLDAMGQWPLASGHCPVAIAQRPVVSGQWTVDSRQCWGQYLEAIGWWQLDSIG